MSTNINLLLRTDEESLRRKKRIKIFKFAALASLVSVGLLSLVIFIFTQAASNPSIKKEQDDLLEKMSQLQSRQVKLFVVNNRVENIDKILKTRKDLSKTMNSLLAKIPSQVLVSDFEIDGKSVTITGQSKSLLAIGELINNLTDMVRKKEIIESLTLNSLILDGNRNTYQISVRSEL